MDIETLAPERATTIWRIILALVLLNASLFCAPYAIFFGLVGPPALALPLTAFALSVMLLLSIAVGMRAAKRRKFAAWGGAVMVTLSLVVLLYHCPSVHEAVLSTFIAAVGVVAVTLFLTHRERRELWLATAAAVAFAVFLAAAYFDIPRLPDKLPDALLEATDGSGRGIARFHNYSLGGFLNSESLWRIDAAADVLETVASKAGMSRTDRAPAEFWNMPPYYWPRSLPAGAHLYATPGFERARGGIYYFMLIDAQRSLAVVWVKSYF